MKNNTKVIMNEEHKLTRGQKKMLDLLYMDYEIVDVPSRGWTTEEQQELVEKFDKELSETDGNIIFVSPVPYLMKKLTERSTERRLLGKPEYSVRMFHNDGRKSWKRNWALI